MASDTKNLHCLTSDSLELAPTGHGRLDGTTFMVKDMFAIKGHVASFGHDRWRQTHLPSTETSPLILRLLEAGAHLKGLNVMDQVAYSILGTTSEDKIPVNPLYPDRVPGGSSSGTAVAVAGGLADFGIGSDTAGSIRVPAAACGIYSLRPTLGRIDTEGMQVLSPTLDVAGLMARDVSLLSDVFDQLAEPNTGATPIRRVLIPNNVDAIAAPFAADAFRQAVAELQVLPQLTIIETDLNEVTSPTAGYLIGTVYCEEIWPRYSEWFTANSSYLDWDIQQRIQQTANMFNQPDRDKLADNEAWAKYMHAVVSLLPAGTAIMLPTISDLPPKLTAPNVELLGFREAIMRLTAASCLTGTPQLVIPVQNEQDKQTYSFSLLGGPGHDEALLNLGKRLAQTDTEILPDLESDMLAAA